MNGSDFCYKIERTYTVVNWCEWNEMDEAVVGPRTDDAKANGWVLKVATDGSEESFVGDDDANDTFTDIAGTSGKWMYTQILKVTDNIAPTASVSADAAEFIADDAADAADCEGTASFSFSAADECAGVAGVIAVLSVTVDGNAVDFDFDGANGTGSGSFGLGAHTVVVVVSDDCGNTASSEDTFIITNSSAPVCVTSHC